MKRKRSREIAMELLFSMEISKNSYEEIAEMLYINDVPEVVAINEAIELTKKYSDDKSVSFVNGALDKAFKNIK